MSAKLSSRSVGIYEILLTSRAKLPGKLEILEQLLVNAGIARDQIVRKGIDGAACLAVYVSSQKDVTAFRKLILSRLPESVNVKVEHLLPSDWQDKWKKDFKPFALTSSFDVVPLWERENYLPYRREPIFLDTALAFGTGLHETTRFMANLIEGKRGRFDTFLDIGTGTGILSMIAYRCGAKKVTGVDLSADVITVAKSNLKENGLKFTRTYSRDFREIALPDKFDFVAANLATHDLIDMRKKVFVCLRPEQYLAVSGISLPNLKELQTAYRDFPLRCLRVLKGKKWAALLYRKLG